MTLVSIVAWVGSAAAAVGAPDAAAKAVGIGEPVAAFAAEVIKVSGDSEERKPFDSQKTGKATAFVIVGTTCPTTSAYIDRFKELEAAYTAKGVDFIYVYPNRDDDTNTKLAFHKKNGFKGGLIDDQGGRVTRLLKSSRTSELILVDKQGTMLFRGGIDDSRDAGAVQRRHAAVAMDEHLAGKPVTVPVTQVFA